MEISRRNIDTRRKIGFGAIIICFLTFFSYADEKNINFMLAEELVKNDIDIFIKGESQSSVLFKAIPTVTASKLINEYKSNQLSYEDKYDGKVLRIKTIVSGIKTTVTKQAYIEANGDTPYESVSLFVDRKDKDILNLKVGNRIDMICLGTSNNIMYPFLEKCIFLKKYLETLKSANVKYLLEVAVKEQKPKYLIGAAYNGVRDAYFNNKKIKLSFDKNHSLQKITKDKELSGILNISIANYIKSLNYSNDDMKNMSIFILPKP